MKWRCSFRCAPIAWLLPLFMCGCTSLWSYVVSEQRNFDVRDVSQLPRAPLPETPPPETVTHRVASDIVAKQLSLDEAIHIALQNSQVIRVLAGVSAVSSGQTIYDPAISNTAIDQAKSVFDPVFGINNQWNRAEIPTGILDPLVPAGAGIAGLRTDSYNLDLGVSKRNPLGGTLRFDFAESSSIFRPGVFPLNPQQRTAATLSYTQPLLKGAGAGANMAPIVIARINTEISYFQFKDSVQAMVRGVIEAYWNVVFAQIDVWARQQQVDQGQAAYDRAEARKRQGFGNAAEVAQTKVSLSNFKANLIGSQANLLRFENALRNILGLRPSDFPRLELTTPPTSTRVEPRWEEVVQLAEQRRPDLIELKLIIEADRQNVILANNNARPQVDATMLYRWNGLEGRTPTGAFIGAEPGQFTDWTIGVNFSVPLGLRQGRAALRQAELLVKRDEANLEQGLHASLHTLAGNMRNLAQYYEQYQAFKETKTAARENLEQQLAEFKAGRAIYLNVLQAISAWGDAVSAEAQSLMQYNTELANLEKETGTILDTHGVTFFEERFRAIGPLGRLAHPRLYPAAVPPGPNVDRYPPGTEPADRAFQKDAPVLPK